MRTDHINCPIRPRVTLTDPDEPLEMIGFTVARYKFACKWMRETDRVMEAGCGEGFGCNFFSRHVAEVVGLDIDEPMVAQCRKQYVRENLTFMQGDITDAQADLKSSFDSIVSFEMIEHVSLDQGGLMVSNCASYLKPGGMLILSTPRRRDDRSVSRQHHHVFEYDYETLTGLLKKTFGRVMIFCQNDEYIYAGHHSTAWNYIACCFKAG